MLNQIGLSFCVLWQSVIAGAATAVTPATTESQQPAPSITTAQSSADRKGLPEPNAEELSKSLRQSRVLAAKNHVEAMLARFEAGTADATADLVFDALADLADAELDVADTPQARVAARSNFVRATFSAEMKIIAFFMAGDARGTAEQLSKAKSRRLKGQVNLVAECSAAKLPLPPWPLLPIGSPDGRAAALVDELGGLYSTATWFAGEDADNASNEPTITYILLDGEKVDDRTILKLAELKSLARLELFNTKVTEAGVAALKKSLPKLEVARSTRVR